LCFVTKKVVSGMHSTCVFVHFIYVCVWLYVYVHAGFFGV
jgi:hypothetical protein